MAITLDGTDGITTTGLTSSGIDDNATSTAVTIDSSGNVGIGESTPLANLQVNGTNNGDVFYLTSSDVPDDRGLMFSNSSNGIVWDVNTPGTTGLFGQMTFSTNSTERMRLDSSGKLLVGRTGPDGGTLLQVGAVSGGGIGVASGTTSTIYALEFRNPNGVVGRIETSGSSTSYVTTSDYRLKENVVSLDNATDRLKQIPVHRFNFTADADVVVDGFLAHEVQDVVPEAITGTKDEVDEEGNPVYQGIDQSKLVPLLVATVKELEARIAALEAN